jgi:hypothetical protein
MKVFPNAENSPMTMLQKPLQKIIGKNRQKIFYP